VVLDRHTHEHVGGRRLGVGHIDGPVAAVVEHPGVEQLELGVVLAPPAVLLDQAAVGELGLRVVVTPAQQGVAGQGVVVPPVLLGVLAVVALGPGEPEHPLLEHRIAPVPQRERQADVVVDVGEAGHPVLVPPVGAGPGMVVGKYDQASPSSL
jgi:hypothetical protein